jgi:hypothetical protein
MKRILVLFIVISLLPFCSTKKASTSADYVVFSLRKTECKGKCPVYYMEIFKSGKAVFEGKKNTDKIGSYTRQIDKSIIEKLIVDFNQAGFFGFHDEYTSKITDLPSTYISFRNNGTSKTIRDYAAAPNELKRLEKLIEQFVDEAGWEKDDIK